MSDDKDKLELTREELVTHIDVRLEMLLDAPQMWGDLQAQEAVAMTLLELRAKVLNPSQEPPSAIPLMLWVAAQYTGPSNLAVSRRGLSQEQFSEILAEIIDRYHAEHMSD